MSSKKDKKLLTIKTENKLKAIIDNIDFSLKCALILCALLTLLSFSLEHVNNDAGNVFKIITIIFIFLVGLLLITSSVLGFIVKRNQKIKAEKELENENK